VSGHGAEAGLVALRFKHRITALLRTDMDLLEAFTTATEELDSDDEKFLSCILVEVRPGSGRVRWINAGHPPALVLRGSGDKLEAEELAPTGPLIGALFDGWTVAETTLEPGQLLLAMTDGIVEARRGPDEEFEIEGVLRTLRGLRRLTPKVVVSECVEAVRRYADDWTRDDITIVALEVMPWA
jgi:serine phosphatase RsbU (regulator of sigma subunit)